MSGGSGDDTLQASNWLQTASGHVLTGGSGADTFQFRTFDVVTDGNGAHASAAAHITDFRGAGAAAGDVIDLSPLDANPNVAGDQAFTLAKLANPGKVWLTDDKVSGDTVMHARAVSGGDVLTAHIADGAVAASAYTAADFIL